MRPVQASIIVKGRTVEAEQLWYDRHRWASWIDGFGHVAKLDDHWPQAGAKLLWDSRPGGRGRVMEIVTRYEVRSGQELKIEDAKLIGTQKVAFEPGDEETKITLTLEVEPKERLAPARRWWLRRTLAESLQRTLRRFSVELAAERQFGHER